MYLLHIIRPVESSHKRRGYWKCIECCIVYKKQKQYLLCHFPWLSLTHHSTRKTIRRKNTQSAKRVPALEIIKAVPQPNRDILVLKKLAALPVSIPSACGFAHVLQHPLRVPRPGKGHTRTQLCIDVRPRCARSWRIQDACTKQKT